MMKNNKLMKKVELLSVVGEELNRGCTPTVDGESTESYRKITN